MAQITSGSLTIVDVTDGAAGLNNTTVFLYQRATSAPDKPTGDLTYTFATASITGALEGWTQNIDNLSGSDPIWMIAAVASSNGKTDIIESSEWAGPIKMAQNGQDGQPGTPGTPGTPGANGLNQATIFVYKRDDSATTPSKTTYTFATGNFTTPSGWSKTIPTEPKGKPCWVTSAIAIGAEATAELNWATPSVLVEDGSNGKNGISPVVTATENGVKIVDSEGNETYITNGANGTSYYTFVRYSKNANGSGYVATPTSETIYIGVYSGTKNSPPAYNDSGWTWSKYVGPRGVQGVSVVSTRELYYLKTNSTDPTQITSADQIHTIDDVNQWTSVVPTYIGSGKYYTCIETKLDNGTVWGAPIENKGLTDANANATQAIEIAKGVRQHFFWLPEDVSTNIPSGAYIAEENEETFKAGPTKGNVLTRSDGIWIRNGIDKLATLQGSGLTLLVPTGTYKGQKSVSLNGTGLTFYNIGSSNSAAATLASDGLQITNGSVVLGTTDGTAAGNVTLSNKNFTRSINGTSHNDLRFAIGSKFGVASDGTLYSSGLNSVASRVDKTEAHLIGMYATSSTAAGTAAKVATITPAIPSGTNWELSTGTTITVKFTNANTTASPTLNVNSKGAKPIKTYANGNLTEAEYKWAAGSTFTFTYNGTNWLMQDSTTSVRMNSAETSISNNAEAITLRATKTEAYQLAQPNLSPWFSYSPYKVNDYWTTSSFNSLFTYTDMGDGWVRVQCTNNTSAVVRSDPRPIRCESIQPNSDYTFLYEVRNNHSTIGSTADSNIYVVQNNNSQFWGGNCKKNLEGDRSDTYIVIKNLPQDSSTPYIKRFVKTSEPEDSSHWTGTVDGLGAIVQRCAAGDTIDYELRISIYEGEYTGPYKPYSGTQLYASEAELKITNDNVLIKATKDDTTNAQGGQHLIQSLINVAPEGVKIAANKVEIDGSAIFSAISSDVNAAVSNVMTTGLGMKVNYSSFTTANTGECYFHGFNTSNVEADVDGWVIWNGEKLTITKGMWINPNGAVPVNTPIFHVFRTSASPYHSDVWWDSSLSTWRGYAYTTDKVPGTKVNWTWNEATDCILAVYVATGNEAISSAQLFTTPKKFSELPNPSDIQNIVNTSIDSIEIGGRNLLQGTANPQISTSYNPPYYNVRSGGDGVGSIESIEDSPVAGITRAFRITGNTTGNRDFVQLVKDFNILWTDGQWMFSCYAKGINASATALIRVYTTNLAFQTNISVGTSWTRIEVPISLNGSGAKTDEIKFQFGIVGAGSIEYIAPMLERGNKTSSWSPAPEDTVAREQRIYYRTDVTAPLPGAPSTWITETSTLNRNWTTKRMQYERTYPYLFTCIQSIGVSGAISHTDVLLDDTTTVIDGGKIIAGSVSTEQLATNAIKSLDYEAPTSSSAPFSVNGTFFDLKGDGKFLSKNFAIDANGNAYFNGQLTATSLVIAPGAVVEGDASQMLSDVYAPSLTRIKAKYNRYFSDPGSTSTACSFVSAGDEVLPDPNAEYFVRIKNTEVNKYKALCFYGSANYENVSGMVVGDTYKVSCWVRQLKGSSNFCINLGGVGGKNYTDTTFVPSTEWQKYEKVFTFTDHNKDTTTVWSRLYFYNRAGAEINGAGTGVGQIDMCGFKLERIDATTASGRNLCLRSADYSGWGKNNGITFNGNIITFPTVTANTWRSAWGTNCISYSVVRNQKITVTYKIKGAIGKLLGSYISFGLNSDSTRRLKFIDKYCPPIYATGEWQTVAFSLYVNDYIFASGSGSPDYNSCYFDIQVGARGDADGRNGFQMKEIMITLGSDPCAWSPAPEDSVIYTNESVDAIEIGGKNLHKHSEKLDSAWTAEQATISTSTGIATLTRTGSGNCRIYQMPANAYWTWEAGVKYTASVEAKASENGVVLSFDCNSSGTITYDNNRRPSLTTEWKRYSCTFTITGTVSTGSMTYSMATTTTGKTIYLRKPMLERGNKPSDWSPAPEDETNARKLLIREVTSGDNQGIEVGYENGSYKAFINAAGSFDVINATGETVASFSETSIMRSVRTETLVVDVDNDVRKRIQVEAWQRLTSDGTQFYKREHSIDEDFIYDESQSTLMDAYGLNPQGINTIFTLGTGVRGPNETKLWHMKTSNSDYIIEGKWFGAGYITTQKKKVNFTIPLCIPIVEGEGITVSCHDDSGMDLVIRQNNKYIFGSADGPENIESEYVSISTCPSGVNVSIDFPSALSDAINNDAVGISCDYFIKVDDGEHYYSY